MGQVGHLARASDFKGAYSVPLGAEGTPLSLWQGILMLQDSQADPLTYSTCDIGDCYLTYILNKL